MILPELDYVSAEEWVVNKVRGFSVLHLGCAGDYLKFGHDACLHYQICTVAKRLHGVELNSKALEKVKEWVPEDSSGKIKYYLGDVQDLSFLYGNKYDIILAGSIIEHLSNPGQMLESFVELCAADGLVIIVTPHVFGLMQFLRVALYRKEAVNPDHTCWFSISTLSELCSRYNLVPVEWHTGFGWRPKSWKWTIMKNLGVPLFKIFPHLGGSLIGVFRPDV